MSVFTGSVHLIMQNIIISIAAAAGLAFIAAALVTGIVLTGIRRSYKIANRYDIYK